MKGKWAIQGGAGFALFLIVLFWWFGGSAPIKPAPIDPTSSTKTDTTSGAVPPLVKGGAPVGTKFQYTYHNSGNPSECVSYTKNR